MPGPLKFLENARPIAKAAVGGFSLTLGVTGPSGPSSFGFGSNAFTSIGSGGTITINWGIDNTTESFTLTRSTVPGFSTWFVSSSISPRPCGSTITISGPNTINYMTLNKSTTGNIFSITGSYPTSLENLSIQFGAVPTWTPPNIENINLLGATGPSSFTGGSKLIYFTSSLNLASLNLTASTKLTNLILTSTEFTTLPTLPSSLLELTTPPNITSLSGLPAKLTYLGLFLSTELTTLPTLPSSLLRLQTPPNITSLSGLPTNLTSLNLIASTKLTSVNLGSATKLTTLTGLPASLLELTTPPNITSLPVLPSSLTSLNLTASTKLTSVNLSGLTQLTQVPGLPKSCTTLNLTGCTGIRKIKLDSTIVKTAIFTDSGITEPSLFLVPQSCNYTF